MVFDQQDSSRNTVSRRVCDLRHSLRCCFWKHESDLCPRAWRRLNLGMTTMDQSLRDLYVRGVISFEEAMTRAMNAPELEKMIKTATTPVAQGGSQGRY